MKPPNATSSGLRPASLVLTTLASLAFSSTALAQVSGHTSASGLSYTLTDLDPLDGISPSLVFKPLPFVAAVDRPGDAATLSLFYSHEQSYDGIDLSGSGSTTPLTHTYNASEDVYSTAAIRGRDQPLTHEIEFTGFARTNGTALRITGASLDTGLIEFVLSPNTAVEFRLNVNIDSSTLNGAGSNDFSQSVTALYVHIGDPLFNPVGLDYVIGIANATTPAVDIVDTLIASTENRTATYVDAATSFEMHTYVSSGPLSAIPEPRSLPMLAFGVAILGAWSGRRRTSRADVRIE